MSSSAAQRIKLKQVPIDTWSIREKLALASSVLRSGDQNWYSVSRSLKPFGEPNRPADWFSQKNCALQYSELLENVETPKRKRGERGENTAQDLIVLELQQKRIEELRELVAKEKLECSALHEELMLIKSGRAGPEKFQEVWDRMKQKEKDKEKAEEEHKNWLIEREAKIAQMKANRHLILVRSPKPSRTAQQPVSPNETEVKAKTEATPEPEKPSVPEPLTVKIEPSSTDSENQHTDKTKILPPPVITTPSTSPLLTHLLQSPSPTGSAPYNILSPVALKDMQQRTSPSTTNVNFFPQNTITSPTMSRRPATPLSSLNPYETTPQATSTTPSSFIEPIKPSIKESDSQTASLITTPLSSPQTVAPTSSPTLSKLLETSPPALVKLPLASIETQDSETRDELEKGEIQHQLENNEPMTTEPRKEQDEIPEPVKIEEQQPEKIQETVIDEQSITVQPSEEADKAHPEALEEASTADVENESTIVEEIAEVNQETENHEEQSMVNEEPVNQIKQEVIEAKELTEENSMDGDIRVKNEDKTELEEAESTPSAASKATAGSSIVRKRKRQPTPMVATPTVTRRSGRVRAKDHKNSSEEEQPSASEPTPAEKKQPVASDPPPPPPPPPPPIVPIQPAPVSGETSASEESMDNTSVNLPSLSKATSSSVPSKPSSIIESVPNSPASGAPSGEDVENQREYKTWKKSILLLWRQASTHKYSSTFLQPVTDVEAKGYSTVVYRPIDLSTIKKKIETGQIKTTTEFQRDIMLMFQNAIMYNKVGHEVHRQAVEMQKETLEAIEDYLETQQKSDAALGPPTKPRGRRSHVSTSSTDAHEQDPSAITSRRKRTSTDTEPGATPSTKGKTKRKQPTN